MLDQNDHTTKLTKVFITIDVECGEYSPNYDGCVWGRLLNFPGENYGLPLILNLLKQVKLKAVFFVEALSSFRHGINNFRVIVDSILSEGHEIQLHIHPSLVHPTRIPDAEIHLGKYSINEQVKFIEIGLDVLTKCGAENVNTFRAGGFGANNDTFCALGQCGLKYDSSYNLNYLNSSCNLNFEGRSYNDVFVHENIVEFPITCFKNPFSLQVPYRHLQITAASFAEIRKALLLANKQKMNAVTILLHSFEFLKFYNKERTKGKAVRININRFEKLLTYLASNRDSFNVCGFQDLPTTYINTIKNSNDNAEFVPKLPISLKLHRQLEQFIANFL